MPALNSTSAALEVHPQLPDGRKQALLIIISCACIIYIFYVHTIHFTTWTTENWLNKLNFFNAHCGWNNSIFVSPDGHYQLHLCYSSVYDKSNLLNTTPTIEESKIRINGSSRLLTFEELASIPDAEWLPNFDRSVYQLYPQSIPMRETIELLINDKPISQPPIFNPWIRFLRVPSRVCSPLTPARAKIGLTGALTHPTVVIIYKSGVYNFEERRQLRKLYNLSYTDINIHLIFSIGLPRTSLGNIFQRDGFNEMHEHNDLLVGDYEDSYYNLTLKLFHTFQWAARFCRSYKPVLVYLDDDYAVNTNKMANIIRGLTPELRDNLNHGCDVIVNPVFRSTSYFPRWAFSKREAPWPRHTPEYLGIYSVWGYRHVHDLALAMHFTKPMVIDDTWLGMVQYKLNLPFSRMEGICSASPTYLQCLRFVFSSGEDIKAI
ncbi:Beta-1,3-galactosyltransferase brn [Echinococcus granulosus]|uniref:Hexosyltransferase n=1 Tax=Echinococcus granulosus TaxID=6210 RepID=W6TZM2_ECHGR|nr:Beta-1,3-galactosyltransferase brn [Echinococcus granulosus]EUB54280.1 Beta-1,3-galactosyltransferase brn [Echinococcus granulosus]